MYMHYISYLRDVPTGTIGIITGKSFGESLIKEGDYEPRVPRPVWNTPNCAYLPVGLSSETSVSQNRISDTWEVLDLVIVDYLYNILKRDRLCHRWSGCTHNLRTLHRSHSLLDSKKLKQSESELKLSVGTDHLLCLHGLCSSSSYL